MNAALDLRTLYEKHYWLVYRIALRRGVPERYAEDVTQQVFEKVLPAYDASRPLLPYLLVITRNEVYQFRKHYREEPAPLRPVEVYDDRPSPEELLRLAEKWRVLKDILARLRPEPREVFELAEIERFSHEEIAGLLGVPLTTVESRLRIATRKVREAIHRLRAGGNLPAMLVDAWRDIEASKGVQGAAWQNAWLQKARRGAFSAAQACAVVVVAGIVPLRSAVADAGLVASTAGSLAESVIASGRLQPSPHRVAATSPPVEISVPRSSAGVTPPPTMDRAGHSPPGKKQRRRPDDPAQSELILMQGARRAFIEGNMDLALKELLRHKRQYPKGTLSKLRDALLRRILQQYHAKL